RSSIRPAHRLLATDIVADYAADQPQLLAELLMDSDDKQFAVFYPRLKQLGERGLVMLVAEIDKNADIDRQLASLKQEVVIEETGQLVDSDPQVKSSKPTHMMSSQRFEVQLQAGRQYRLTMDSLDLDSYIILQDKAGRELAYDDDSGGGLNSLLNYTPLR